MIALRICIISALAVAAFGCYSSGLQKVGVGANYKCRRVMSSKAGWDNKPRNPDMSEEYCKEIAALEDDCINTMAYNPNNQMCYLYACDNDPANVEVVSEAKHASWPVYSVFGKVPQDSMCYPLELAATDANYKCTRVLSTQYDNKPQNADMTEEKCVALAASEPVCIETVTYNPRNKMCYMYNCEGNADNVVVVRSEKQKDWKSYSAFGKVEQDNGCASPLEFVGIGANYKCERVRSTVWDNKPQNEEITEERCIRLSKLEDVCIDTVAYNPNNKMCYMYNCGGDASNVHVERTDKQATWKLYSVFGQVAQDDFQY